MHALLVALIVAAPDAPPAEVKKEYTYEVTMGFAGALIDPSALPLVPTESASNFAAIAAPFGGPGLQQLITAGPAWEMRSTLHHLRFTTGLQKPWAQFRQGSLDADVVSSPLGTSRVSPRSLSLWVLRFGLGGEYTFGPVTPFADLLGDIQWATADVVVDGQRGQWTSAGFSFSVRAGARVKVGEFLAIGLAGEYGLGGAPRFGATLLAGWAFSMD